MSSQMVSLHQDANEELHIPARLLSNKLFTKQLFLSRNSFIYILITKNFEFYELLSKNVMNKINLAEHLRKVKTVELEFDINLKLYFRYADFVDGNVNEFYLLQVFQTLVVIKRTTMEVIALHNHVVDYSFTVKESLPYIKIKFSEESGKEILFTNFLLTSYDSMDYEQCVSEQSEPQNNFFSDSLILLENKTKNALADLSVYEELTRKSVLEELCEARFGSDEVLSEFPDEKIPLIKYGDTWTKIHNEKLIIGIPILNCTYSRSLNLFNIKPILINSKQTYSYNLFTLTNDAFEFNNQLEDFTQAASPQISTNFNNIDENWIVCKDNVLETGRSGIVIIKQSLTDFQLPIAYQTFLLFKFNHETKIYAQQIYIGTILIDPKILFESNSTVQMERNELYKDFLTIVSTSRQESVTVKLERDRLINFLTQKLKFIMISESGVFYKNDSYWSNTLVRYDYSVAAESQNECNMKIYSSGKHQIDTFIRCLVYEHGDRCYIIKPAQNIVKNFTLYKNLLTEIGMKIEYLKNVERLDKLLELYTSEMITEIKCVLE